MSGDGVRTLYERVILPFGRLLRALRLTPLPVARPRARASLWRRRRLFARAPRCRRARPVALELLSCLRPRRLRFLVLVPLLLLAGRRSRRAPVTEERGALELSPHRYTIH